MFLKITMLMRMDIRVYFSAMKMNRMPVIVTHLPIIQLKIME